MLEDQEQKAEVATLRKTVETLVYAVPESSFWPNFFYLDTTA